MARRGSRPCAAAALAGTSSRRLVASESVGFQERSVAVIAERRSRNELHRAVRPSNVTTSSTACDPLPPDFTVRASSPDERGGVL